MAMTAAERKRLQRERDKKREEEERHELEDSTYPFLKVPFGEWWKYESSFQKGDFDLPLELAGIQPPNFSDERDPKEFVINDATDLDDPFPGAKGAVGRAEVMIDCLLDAARELATVLNSYKRSEIEARLAELENSNADDAALIIKEAVQLNKILDQLKKRVRQDFPQWKVTGV